MDSATASFGIVMQGGIHWLKTQTTQSINNLNISQQLKLNELLRLRETENMI